MPNPLKPKRSYTSTAVPSSLLAGELAIQAADKKVFLGNSSGTGSILIASLSLGDMIGSTSNITEGSNLYFTDARSRLSISAGTGIGYNNTTGVVTNSLPDQTVTLTAGSGISVTGTYPNFTVSNSSPSSGGTVTSVGLSAPTGMKVTNSPVTSSGTITLAMDTGYALPTTASQGNWDTAYANRITSLTTNNSSGSATLVSNVLNVPTYTLAGLGGIKFTDLSSTATGLTYTNTTGVFSLTSGYSIPTTASQTNWDSAYTQRLQWDGGSTNLTASTGRTSLGATTVGGNLFTLTNPSAITFPRINADNTVSTLDAATFRAAIGAGTSSTSGTVTSVAALTLGTTGTDLSSSVSNGTTTPAITLNVPTASATNRGALSSGDWSNFNTAYSNRITSLTTTGSSGSATLTANTLNIPTYTLSGLGGQPSSTNLTSLAGLSYVSASFVKMTAAGTFSLDTSAYLTGNQSISVTGDATGSGTTSIALTLANSGVSAGTVNNSATAVTPITVDAKGRITSTGAAVTITPAFASLTSKPTTLNGYGITDAQPLDADLTAIAALAGTSGLLKKTAADTWSLDTSTYLTSNQTITLSGDVTGTGTTAITTTLATVAIAKGGTGQTTQQSAINALTGTQSSGKYLRSDGTNATLATIQAADVPVLNQNTSGTAAGLSTTLAVASGGTGQTTANAAFNALAPSQTSNSGKYLKTDGTNTSWATVTAGSVFTASATAPVSPNAGDSWFDTTNGVYLIYFNDGNSSQWVESSNSVQSAVPTGGVMPFAGTAAPSGYLLCDGSSVSSTTYLALHAVISNTYGGSAYTGASGLNFNLPDLRSRIPICAGTGTGLTARTLGTTYGTETHTLATTNIPQMTTSNAGSHSHTFSKEVLTYRGTGGDRYDPYPGTVWQGSAGAGLTLSTQADHSHTVGTASPTAVNHLPPALALNYIIKT